VGLAGATGQVPRPHGGFGEAILEAGLVKQTWGHYRNRVPHAGKKVSRDSPRHRQEISMSAFNTVYALVACPRCGAKHEFDVQFKFGDTWQHIYRVGDYLRWGGNDVGAPGCEAIVVEGIGGTCPNCNTEFLYFDVVVVADRIAEVRPSTLLLPPSD
jgi:hypothetical protein